MVARQAASNQMLAMPSRGVDVLWHEFILREEDYGQFCEAVYGTRLNHVPESSMSPSASMELNGPAMARTFAMACIDEGIRPDHPDRLPVLFTVDDRMDIADSTHWDLDAEEEPVESAQDLDVSGMS